MPWMRKKIKPGELTRGTWFAVPQLGRFLKGQPQFHVVTANHVLHPFWYPEFYPMGEGEPLEFIKYFGAHDPYFTLHCASADGKAAHTRYEMDPGLTYAHPQKHFDVGVVHPSWYTEALLWLFAQYLSPPPLIKKHDF